MSYYLDNAATTPITEDMKNYLVSMLCFFGNPSSAHSKGVMAKKLTEEVRCDTLKFINADFNDDILFTSSGSASNALAIQGFCFFNKDITILYSPTVHKSILNTIHYLAEYHNIGSFELRVDSFGNIDIDYLKFILNDRCSKKLVVVDYANSEIGTIQNIKAISDIVHSETGYSDNKLFVDCTGSISTIPLDVKGLCIDMASFSGHKIGALKGIGVLYKKNDIKLAPLICGSQEQGLFAGTENTLGILSLGKAMDSLKYNKTSFSRDFVWDNIKNINNIFLVGVPLGENRLINNLYICIKDVKGSDAVAMMDDVYKTQVSTGSACNNGSPAPSSIALAIGLSDEEANSCMRVSFSGDETEDELKEFCKNLSNCINILRDLND